MSKKLHIDPKITSDRRAFLIKLAGLGVGLGLTSQLIPKNYYFVEFNYSFPHPMSMDEYKSYRLKWRNKATFLNSLDHFKSAKKLLHESRTQNENGCTWTAVFASKEDFDEWTRFKQKRNVYDKNIREKLGFKLFVKEGYLFS